MRLLAVVPFLFPQSCPPARQQTDAEAICGAKMVKALLDRGVDLRVIAFDQAGARVDGSFLWQGLEDHIVRIQEQSNSPLWSRCLKSARHGVNAWIDWIDRTVRHARLEHRKRPFDAVYSRSLPSAGHMAGYRVARTLGLRWICNINDPWGPSVTPGYAGKPGPVDRFWDLFWLRRTLRAADLVTYPCERLGSFHRQISGVEHRMEVIPHVGYGRQVSARSDMFVLTHAGNLSAGRSGTLLLQAFLDFLAETPEAQACSRLVFVGEIDPALKGRLDDPLLTDRVVVTGRVNYEQSLDHMASASALVLIEKQLAEGVFLPSKLCDYFAMEKPILALSPSRGVVADLAAEHRGILMAEPQNKQAIQQAIRELYQSWRSTGLGSLALDPRLSDMVRPCTLAGKLIDAIRSTVLRNPIL
jgi:hypothetical protein